MSPSKNAQQLEAEPTVKRGRGRPRVANPLSGAQRAKRHRDKKRNEQLIANPGSAETRIRPTTIDIGAIQSENVSLHAQLEALRKDMASLAAIADILIRARLKKSRLAGDVFRNLCQSHMALTSKHAFL